VEKRRQKLKQKSRHFWGGQEDNLITRCRAARWDRSTKALVKTWAAWKSRFQITSATIQEHILKKTCIVCNQTTCLWK
jgi:hypothetical protein